jgi:para-aminobenzoate synthetase component 1
MVEKVNYIKEKMNLFGSERTPFLFIINFDCTDSIIIPLDEISSEEILFNFENFSNYPNEKNHIRRIGISYQNEKLILDFPIEEQKYHSAFLKIQEYIANGDTYLLNLTFPTKIETDLSLQELFFRAFSKYKIYLQDKFVCFSPEIFVKIEGNEISSYPMKGTISALVPDAEDLLLKDEKEIAEHYTIVDLLRNDLSIVAKRVRVEKFRYIDRIRTSKGEILQTSSKITGILDGNWNEKIGDIITKMLPAGSVTGAPKLKTLEIIKETEDYDRGYYTGIAGIYDGNTLDSCVLIRFIEKNDEGFVFKSGGGITSLSNSGKEYLELLEKIYVPTL